MGSVWQYKILKMRMVSTSSMEETMDIGSAEIDFNSLGAHGWELVQMIPNAPLIFAIFKKKVF